VHPRGKARRRPPPLAWFVRRRQTPPIWVARRRPAPASHFRTWARKYPLLTLVRESPPLDPDSRVHEHPHRRYVRPAQVLEWRPAAWRRAPGASHLLFVRALVAVPCRGGTGRHPTELYRGSGPALVGRGRPGHGPLDRRGELGGPLLANSALSRSMTLGQEPSAGQPSDSSCASWLSGFIGTCTRHAPPLALDSKPLTQLSGVLDLAAAPARTQAGSGARRLRPAYCAPVGVALRRAIPKV